MNRYPPKKEIVVTSAHSGRADPDHLESPTNFPLSKFGERLKNDLRRHRADTFLLIELLGKRDLFDN
ncbi:MAG: hypothetical protein HKL80_11375 [Acidimicrobiales bacterium]|nr:hypothetical protein [Acidimicrobiales bacterium]